MPTTQRIGVQPSSTARPARPQAHTRRWPAWAIALALFGLALALGNGLQAPQRRLPDDTQPTQSVAAADPAKVWTSLAEKRPLFGLSAGDPALALTRYEARRRADTGAREDSASYGVFAAGPYFHIALRRSDGELPASHFVDAARRAAQAGLALVRLGQPFALATKFNALDMAIATLSNRNAARTCASFRMPSDALGFGLSGWFCDDAGASALPARLACLIDRLVPTPENQDLTLRIAFAETEARALPACAQQALTPSAPDQELQPVSRRRRDQRPRRPTNPRQNQI